MQIPVKMCSNQYIYSKLPIDEDDLDSFGDDSLKSTDSKSDCHGETQSKRLRGLIKKGVKKLSQFMFNCIQPSCDSYLDYMAPDPSTYYTLVGMAYI